MCVFECGNLLIRPVAIFFSTFFFFFYVGASLFLWLSRVSVHLVLGFRASRAFSSLTASGFILLLLLLLLPLVFGVSVVVVFLFVFFGTFLERWPS